MNSLHFNHNGSMLLAGGADGMIRLLDIHFYFAFFSLACLFRFWSLNFFVRYM